MCKKRCAKKDVQKKVCKKKGVQKRCAKKKMCKKRCAKKKKKRFFKIPSNFSWEEYSWEYHSTIFFLFFWVHFFFLFKNKERMKKKMKTPLVFISAC